ncbi:hypothetical protein L1887_15253 [Cichorium endivia]|nr:hypothetical protein L1887_15253 [Cichorium endivia]
MYLHIRNPNPSALLSRIPDSEIEQRIIRFHRSIGGTLNPPPPYHGFQITGYTRSASTPPATTLSPLPVPEPLHRNFDNNASCDGKLSKQDLCGSTRNNLELDEQEHMVKVGIVLSLFGGGDDIIDVISCLSFQNGLKEKELAHYAE